MHLIAALQQWFQGKISFECLFCIAFEASTLQTIFNSHLSIPQGSKISPICQEYCLPCIVDWEVFSG